MGAEFIDTPGDVARDPRKGGADEAYKLLRSDFLNSRDRMANIEASTNDLESKGVLPAVSAAWLKNEFTRIDTNRDGVVDRSELQDVAQGSGKLGSFDATFARTLADRAQFDTIASRGVDEDAIEKSDLNGHLRRDNRENRKSINQADSRDALAPLFDGPDPLINYLDSNGNGRVTRHEMKKFLDDYQHHQGSGPYTEQNMRFVDDLLHRDVPDLHTGLTTGFSSKHAAKEMGLDSGHGPHHKDFSLTQQEYEQVRPMGNGAETAPPGVPPSGPPEQSQHGSDQPGPSAADAPHGAGGDTVTVKKGDNVWNIAKENLHEHEEKVTNRKVHKFVKKISSANGLDQNGRSPDLIYPGEQLFLPPISFLPEDAAAAAAAMGNGARQDSVSDAGRGTAGDVGRGRVGDVRQAIDTASVPAEGPQWGDFQE